MLNLSRRMMSPELLDDLTLPPQAVTTALSALSKMNSFSLTAHYLTSAILSKLGGKKKVHILDLGSGCGDILCSIEHRLARRGILMHAIGVDVNEHAVRFANEHAHKTGSSARFRVGSATEAVREFDYDIVISSLFLHHLEESTLENLFKDIAGKARIGMVMTDLNRTLQGYALVWIATRLASQSPIVRDDGLTSVRGALRPNELKMLGTAAGMEDLQIEHIFPLRLLVSWFR